MLVIWSLFVPCILYLRLSKFQLSAATGCRPLDRTGKKLRVRAQAESEAPLARQVLDLDPGRRDQLEPTFPGSLQAPLGQRQQHRVDRLRRTRVFLLPGPQSRRVAGRRDCQGSLWASDLVLSPEFSRSRERRTEERINGHSSAATRPDISRRRRLSVPGPESANS